MDTAGHSKTERHGRLRCGDDRGRPRRPRVGVPDRSRLCLDLRRAYPWNRARLARRHVVRAGLCAIRRHRGAFADPAQRIDRGVSGDLRADDPDGRRAPRQPLAIAAAAALCVIGLENKVQAILLIALVPIVILPFGSIRSASVTFWQNTGQSWLVVIAAALIAAAASWAAWPLAMTGFDRHLLDAAGFHPLLLGRYGIYQLALIGFILAAMIAYAALWRIAVAETL